MTSPKNEYNTQGGAVFNGNLAVTRDINISEYKPREMQSHCLITSS